MAPAPILPTHNPPSQDAETVMPSAPAPPTTREEGAPDPPTRKRKRGANNSDKENEKQHILYQSTFRTPTWSYLHLRLLTPDVPSASKSSNSNSATPTPDLDPLTTSPLLTTALRSLLGQTGAAIPIDILDIQHRDVWIRVPRQDARAVRMGLSAWIGACEGGNVPEWKGDGRVKVAWRVVREGLRMGGKERDGGELFGG